MLFSKVLVANRGEIARRVMRTCRELGVRTVAVFSPADAESPRVREADQAVALRGDEPAQSYLDAETLVRAAKDTGCEALHPGYGFLSESPLLASACRQARLAFIGPPAEVLARLGDKVEARRLAREAGVEPVPGTFEPSKDTAWLSESAKKLGFPLMIKAAAGGGGKGMRQAKEPQELIELLELARSEARSAFGDGRLYLERLLEGPRHVEVQILADRHGNAVHLFERECSLQRRHQKVIEESPAPGLPEELRGRLHQAALRVARAAGYQNAGTVEFLLMPGGDFYFLEVNARLQVEHPVTESVCGVDLVAEQLHIAAGEKLRLSQEQISCRGHAIECRLVAEDPLQQWRPSPGRLERVAFPASPGLRIDAGVETGSVVSPHYDALIGKLIAWAPERAQAIARARGALSEIVLLGVANNTGILQEVLDSEDFRAGRVHTAWLEEFCADWRPAQEAVYRLLGAYAAAELLGSTQAAAPAILQSRSDDPWHRLSGWRMERR